jgi:hypothetical protein
MAARRARGAHPPVAGLKGRLYRAQMPRTVSPDLVDPVVMTLRGSIDAGDGGTDEQKAVLGAIVTGFLGCRDVDVDALKPISPDEAAAAIPDTTARRRTREMMVLLESCRHPITDAQVTLVESYCAALGGDRADPGLTVARDLVRDGAERALAEQPIADVRARFGVPFTERRG